VKFSSDHERLQAVVSHANAGKLDAAAEVASAIADKLIGCEAWRVLSRVNANTQRLEEARSAIEIALQHLPDSSVARLERALLMEQQGEHQESLAELESLARASGDSPQLLVHLARALGFAGRGAEAEQQLEAALRRWPTDLRLHAQLARQRWSRGAGEASTKWIEDAIEKFPGEPGLRLVAAHHLRNAGDSARALALLEVGLELAPDSAAYLTSIGVLLDDLGRPEEALRYLEDAVARAPGSTSAKRNLVATLLQLGRPAEALRHCHELLELAPDDQQLIAYWATALRLTGDVRYAELHDYARLVRIYRLQPPARFADIGEFNAAFADELSRLHRSEQRPLAQSLRGGTQTERNLPLRNPLIADFFAMLDAPIRDYIAGLRDDGDHPTDRRKSAGYRIAGSWSVQLQPGGFHINHVHPQGWLSSAYYVKLPESAPDDANRAGWLSFGEPGIPVAACPPDHFVKPAAGTLVLFPSYLWHGTVPFSEGGRRLTAAFDVVPR
jgi:tetratricopeptide (TPR) repeat protein